MKIIPWVVTGVGLIVYFLPRVINGIANSQVIPIITTDIIGGSLAILGTVWQLLKLRRR